MALFFPYFCLLVPCDCFLGLSIVSLRNQRDSVRHDAWCRIEDILLCRYSRCLYRRVLTATSLISKLPHVFQSMLSVWCMNWCLSGYLAGSKVHPGLPQLKLLRPRSLGFWRMPLRRQATRRELLGYNSDVAMVAISGNRQRLVASLIDLHFLITWLWINILEVPR